MSDSTLADKSWVQFRPANNVPAFAVMEILGMTTHAGEVILQTDQYTATSIGMLAINGPTDVDSGAYGRCSFAIAHPTMALIDATDLLTISSGDHVGPVDAQWNMEEGAAYFIYLGDSPIAGTGMVCVVPSYRIP